MLEITEDVYANCISCSDKEKPTRKITIKKDAGTYAGEGIVTFNLCYDCLNKLAKEFVSYS